MVNSWYMNSDPNQDYRGECHLNPPQFVEKQQLQLKAGVIQFKLDADHYEDDARLDDIKKQYKCVYYDIMDINPSKNPNDAIQLKRFFEEHLHPEEEVRFILDGSAYFDVRDKEDKWIRVKVEKGDLIILPPGVYHRFTLGFNKSIRIMRLYKQPKWTAYNRCAEEHPSRQIYKEKAANGFA